MVQNIVRACSYKKLFIDDKTFLLFKFHKFLLGMDRFVFNNDNQSIYNYNL